MKFRLKIKRLARRFSYLAIAATILTQTASLIIPNTVDKVFAADDYAKIVRSGDPTQNSIDCQAFITEPTDQVNSTVFNTLLVQAADPTTGTVYPIYQEYGYSLTSEYASYANPPKMLSIYFKGRQPNDDSSCITSMALVQNQDPSGNKKIFYGGWERADDPNQGSHYEPIKGLVDNSTSPGTIKITTSSGASPLTFNIKLKEDKAGTLTNPGYFPGTTVTPPSGGGSTGTGPCYGLTGYALQACIDSLTPHFTDMATIVYNGETYVAERWSGTSDSQLGFRYYLSSTSNTGRKANNLVGNCRPYIILDTDPNSNKPGNPSKGIDLDFDGGTTEEAVSSAIEWLKSLSASNPNNVPTEFYDIDTTCNPVKKVALTVSGVNNMSVFAGYYTGDKITTLLGYGGTRETPYIGDYTKNSSDPKRFDKPARDGCSDVSYILLDQDPSKVAVNTKIKATWNLLRNEGTCSVIATAINVYIVKKESSSKPPATAAPGTGTGTGSGQSSQKSCEDNFPTFGVIICNVLEGIDGILGIVEGTVQKTLEIKPEKYSAAGGTNGANALYFAWVNMARVSSALLVIVSLIMVIGTALGDYKVFSAYTVKKVLPRLVIAAIGMWLSWSIITTYINVISTISVGLADLLWTPFKDVSNVAFSDWGLKQAFVSDKDVSAIQLAGYSTLTVIGGLVGGAALLTGGAWALLSGLVPVVVFMVVGYVVLVLRQSIIIFLLVTAPIAIVSWVLPNTQKLIWGKWFKFLNQLLFMYPMFMAVLAAGKIFSYIIVKGNTDPGLFTRFIPVIAYVTPFILLPGIFKSAGGALSKVTGSGLKFGNRLAKSPREGIANRQALSARTLAKNQRKNFRTQDAQARFARGLTTEGGMVRSLRNRTLGGVATSRAARDAMLAGAIGTAAADRNKRVQDQTELMRHSGVLNDRNELRRIASSTDPKDSIHQRQAALNRLVQIGDDEGIRNAEARYTGPNASAEDKIAWNNLTSSGEFAGAFKDKAPYMIPGRERMFESSPTASVDAAASWNKATWEKAFAGGRGAEYRELAQNMLSNPTASSKVSTEVLTHLRDSGVTPSSTGAPIVPPANGPRPSQPPDDLDDFYSNNPNTF